MSNRRKATPAGLSSECRTGVRTAAFPLADDIVAFCDRRRDDHSGRLDITGPITEGRVLINPV